MAKQEILPPLHSSTQLVRREPAAVSILPPRVDTGGIVQSTLTRWEANRQARAIDAMTRRTQSEVALADAQTRVLESYVKRQRAAYRVQELPEILSNDRAQRRVERANQLREAQHTYEIAEVRRLTELSHAETALKDGQQALEAQRAYGDVTYKVAWKKKTYEMLDVELSAAERRAILQQHVDEMDRPRQRIAHDRDETEETIDDALHERRAELAANGLDTGRIDDAIERRSAKRRRNDE